MIEVKNLKKKFGKLQVLDGIDFSIQDGGIYAILGHNGSGKTTLLKSILGMVLPQSGEIRIDDQPTKNQYAYRKDIGYLPQIAQFPDNLSVIELIEMVKNLRSGETTTEEPLIDRLALTPFLNKKLGHLSGGTRQKVNLILTFMFDCSLYILDEPTAGLDPVSLIELKQLIQEKKEEGKSILITTHIMSLVEELADEIIFLMDGQVYFKGTIDALKLKTNQNNLEHAIAQLLR
ncbi:MAG: ABC transporter ATP-binding protein [Reichenbachiella sp.]